MVPVLASQSTDPDGVKGLIWSPVGLVPSLVTF
jgi:hypothetical protein